MFKHTHKLDPALTPRDYVDPTAFAEERARIFARQWHLVGAQPVLAQPGGQVALDIEGIPVVVRNDDGTMVAFRNVCPHRHSVLVAPGEHVQPTLQCRYHGWQFRGDGSLAQLPDGVSFKGFKARDACLESYRAERLGPLVFVNLTRNTPSLRDTIGPMFDELNEHLRGLSLALTHVSEHESNWKIAVENSLESYHIPSVHPNTFKIYLPAEQQEHELAATHSRYWSTGPLPLYSELAFLGFKVMLRHERGRRYQHILVFPDLLIAYSGIYLEIARIVPLSVGRFRREMWGFLPSDVRRNPLSIALDRVHRRLVRKGTAAILAEDASVWPHVQRGMEHAYAPGVLSIREERVWHFQRWVAAQLGRELAASDPLTSRAAQ